MQDIWQDELEENEGQDMEDDDFGIEEIDLYAKPKYEVSKRKPRVKEEEAVNPVKELISFIFTFGIAIAVAVFINTFVIINANIPSGSMENTIMTGDRLIGNRLAYLFEEPKRGDIVIFKYPDDETQLFVKRIIGLPGEKVTVEDAKVYINGALFEEGYLKEEWVVDAGPYEFEVPEGCYLVLGDNRNNSKDSRYWLRTYVEEDKILGEAVFVYWPFSNLGKLN